MDWRTDSLGSNWPVNSLKKIGSEKMYEKLIDDNYMGVYRLLEYFEKSYSEAISIEELQSSLQISRFKLMNTIQVAQQLSEIYSEYIVEVDMKLKTVVIFFKSSFLLSELYARMLKSSLSFDLLNSLYMEKAFSLEKFAQTRYVSVRTLQRKLRKVTAVLENYYVYLDFRKPSPLIGDEYRIRYYYHTMLWQVYIDSEDSFDNLSYQSKEFITSEFLNYFPHFRLIDTNKFLNMLSITVRRIKQGKLLTQIPEEMCSIYNPLISYDDFREKILIPFFKKNCIEIEKCGINEILCLYYSFTVMLAYLPYELKNINTVQFDNRVSRLSHVFIDIFEKEFSYSLTKDEKTYLFVNLCMIHSASLVFYTKLKMDTFGRVQTTNDFVKVFPKLYIRVESLFKKLFDMDPEFGSLISGNSRLLFQYCMILREILKPNLLGEVRIFVQSKLGKLQEEFQKRKIRQLREDVDVITVGQNDNPEIVITDFPINHKRFSEGTSFFEWGSPQTEFEWRRLDKMLQEWSRVKK